MPRERLSRSAAVALGLNALYSAAEALCSVFLSVYLWVNSHDFSVVCRYYLAVYIVTPVFFLLAGWYSQARDRLHVYRAGIVLQAIFYAVLLLLRERSAAYAVPLGMFLGMTWGVFWAGANTFNFDVTVAGRREYYFGMLSTIGGIVSLLAPLISGAVIQWAPTRLGGYHRVFAIALVLYLGCLAASFWMPRDNVRRPFRIWRALFPGRDQRDWRLMMLSSASLAGSFSIFAFLLSLLMYMKTGNELQVGAYASFQAMAGVITAYFAGRLARPGNRRAFMRWGVITLMIAGAAMAFELNTVTLFIFGLFRSISGPLFGVPYAGLRMDAILACAEEPAQRIEYISAWEVPLAIGRVVMMLMMMLLYESLRGSEAGLRITLFVLCAIRIVTYHLTVRASVCQGPEIAESKSR